MDRMKVNKNLCLALWEALNTRLGPLQWDLVESGASDQSMAKGGGTLPHYTRWPGEERRTPQGLMCSHRP